MIDKLKPVIRAIVLVIFRTLYIVTKRERYQWMAHYLSRKGTDMVVPDRLLKCLDQDVFMYDDDDCIVSTDYPESGFYGRPELFYLVGGFGYRWERTDGQLHITAVDVYDWHPVKEYDWYTGEILVDSWYFVSPVPVISEKWVWRLNDFFGHTFFDYSFDGEFGVSNYFWDWLDGQPFNTIMSWNFQD
jgi:hypothetical protein